MAPQGTWLNPDGYTLRFERREFWPWPRVWSVYRKTYWEFQLDQAKPLTFSHQQGYYVQPDRHELETDLGSIPPPLRSLFPDTEFIRPYLLHDSAYTHHGMYMAHGPYAPFVFHAVDRAFADELLRVSIIADGGSRARARTIWSAVRSLGVRW